MLPQRCSLLSNVLHCTILNYWSLSDNNPHKAGDRRCAKCVCSQPPIAPCTLSHNWVPYTTTCHTGSHCHWYNLPLPPVTLCLAAAAGLSSQHACPTGAEGLCRVLAMTRLAASKSCVFVEPVDVKQLPRRPDTDPAAVSSSKKCAQWRLAKCTKFSCFVFFLYFVK